MYWICFLFWLPFLGAIEVDWQAQQNFCTVNLKISDSTVQYLQPLNIQLLLSCPIAYQIDSEEVKNQLLQSSYDVPSDFVLKTFNQSFFEKENTRYYQFDFEIYFVAPGTYFMTFLNIDFTSSLSNKPSEVIYTPIYDILVIENTALEMTKNMPLMDIEPKIFPTLSQQNQRLINNPESLAKEKIKNLEVLRTHTFPWRIILGLLSLSTCIYLFYCYRESLFFKKIKKQKNKTFQQVIEERFLLLKEKHASFQGTDEIYLELTNLIREYLSNVLNQKIEFDTGQQLSIFLNKTALSEEIKNALHLLFQNAFYFKFANCKPTKNQYEKAFDVVEKLVKSKIKK